MQVDNFMSDYHFLIASDYGESDFAAIRAMTSGVSSPKLGKIINRAVRYFETGDVYLEIGTYTGFTLTSASIYNFDIPCYGIDNLSLFGCKQYDAEKQKELQDNCRNMISSILKHFGCINAKFIEADYKDVKLANNVSIGVLYIDAEHTREEVYKNFEWAHNKLSDNALILIDDISACGVGKGVDDWLKDHGDEYYQFFKMDHGDPDRNICYRIQAAFWNGLSMLRFRRKHEAST